MITSLQCAIHRQSMTATLTLDPNTRDQYVRLLCTACAETQDSLSALSDNVDQIKTVLDTQKANATVTSGVKVG